MRKKNKFVYLFVVQGNYGENYGWEDLTQSETRKEALDDVRYYRRNEPEFRHRIIQRRELNS